jgi:CHU_C Type IX secretion signal domain
MFRINWLLLFFYLLLDRSFAQVSLSLNPDTLFVTPGEVFELPVRVQGFNQIVAFDWTLIWDANLLTLVDTAQTLLTPALSLQPAALRAVWATSEGITLPDSTTLVRLRFKAALQEPVVTTIRFIMPEFFSIVNNSIVARTVRAFSQVVVIRQCRTTVDLGPDQVICPGTTAHIAVNCVQCQGFQWADGYQGTTRNIDSSGVFRIKAQGALRCPAKDSVQIRLAATPTLRLPAEQVLCPGDFAMLRAEVLEPVTFLWSDGSGTNPITVRQPGTYTLTVRNSLGCTATGSTTVVQYPAPQATVTVRQPDCRLPLGAIGLEKVRGAAPPYLYSLDGGSFKADPQFEQLSDGRYVPTLEDIHGCTHTLDPVVLQPPLIPIIAIQSEKINIRAGDSTILRAAMQNNYPLSQIKSVFWNPAREVRFADNTINARFSPLIQPTKSGWYVVSVESIEGCQSTDSVWVTVRPVGPLKIFVPNAIAPDAGSDNARLTIATADERIVQFKRFAVFGRWGALVFERRNFLPNDADAAWDGANLSSDVYVWSLEISLADGSTITTQGDVLLMR